MKLSSTLSNNQRKNFVKKFFFLIRYQIIKTNNNNNYCYCYPLILQTVKAEPRVKEKYSSRI